MSLQFHCPACDDVEDLTVVHETVIAHPIFGIFGQDEEKYIEIEAQNDDSLLDLQRILRFECVCGYVIPAEGAIEVEGEETENPMTDVQELARYLSANDSAEALIKQIRKTKGA